MRAPLVDTDAKQERLDASPAIARIAEYVATAARAGTLSKTAEQSAVRCILDLATAVVVGLDDRGARAVRTMALATIGPGRCPVWFTGETSNAIGAAFANSAAASALDLDDGNRLARGHPGAAVIPAALAVAAETGASSADIIRAIVIGYEVAVTVGAARRFYANTGLWSCYGVVAAAAVLRGASQETIAHALAIAGASAPNLLFSGAGPLHPFPEGSDVKEGIPWSTVTGLTALGLAAGGFTGPRNMLDSRELYAIDEAVAGLGPAEHITRTYFKLYSCCRHGHAPIDALCGLTARHGLEPGRLDAIELDTYSGALRLSNLTRPANLIDAQYSVPYCMALAALVGRSALLPLDETALFRADVSALADKVTLRLDPAIDARFPAETLARVAVTSGGKRYVSEVTAPRGEATSPLSWLELEEKFVTATRRIVTAEVQARFLATARAARDGDLAVLVDGFRDIVLCGGNRR
ncbi:MAG TPA: MmgE/PrpD family protein [Xanthobacteraceae bacterium]|nr:MmgE/PrpD family protein [Xanthobacteraceae bacterium]